MTVWELTVLVWIGSAVAGLLGSLTGLGGGVVLVPLLTLFFKVDIRYAIGASLVSVIATSSGAASAYVKEGISNIRIGMFLEIATTLGAVFGAFLAARVSTSAIAIIFGAVLLYSAYLSARVRVRSKSDEIARPFSHAITAEWKLPYSGRYSPLLSSAGCRWISALCLARGHSLDCWALVRAP